MRRSSRRQSGFALLATPDKSRPAGSLVYCNNRDCRIGCPCPSYVIRCGGGVSSDVLRRNLKCTKCGHPSSLSGLRRDKTAQHVHADGVLALPGCANVYELLAKTQQLDDFLVTG